MKLALGTVQFGIDYGISNRQGKVVLHEVENILSLARAHGITTLDTAAAYGDSEQAIGTLNASSGFSIVTKIPTLAKVTSTISDLLEISLAHLKTKQIQALMFHSAKDLLGAKGEHYYQQASILKQQGKINQLGVSVYNPKQLNKLMQKFDLDIVQVPLNCMDQRFTNTELRQQLQTKKIEVHVRSVFLQGLLLIPLPELAPYFQPFHPQLNSFHALCKQLNCQALTLALLIIHQNPFINKAVIGCCSTQQLEQIIEHYYLAKKLSKTHNNAIAQISCSNEALINPSNWSI
jgi:aryl-alcohol dehydrogenase-like predicted oxidoreductase